MLSERELKEIKNDAHYGLRQLFSEIERLKQQLGFVQAINESIESQLEVLKNENRNEKSENN